MKIGLVVPHIFMQQELLEQVIFSPGGLAISLADSLQASGNQVFLFTPGAVTTKANNITADLSYFEKELNIRGDTYLSLLKKHPLTFITISRQVQSELIAEAYRMANTDELDIVHIYTNEEDNALPFARLCSKPVIFTHHDPFNFLAHYKSVFPKYPDLNWLSLSYAQRGSMPEDTNWVSNIYHGLKPDAFEPNYSPEENYVAYFGRIIESKGVHLAIAAVKSFNEMYPGKKLRLKIAGKHYSNKNKNKYWEEIIEPEIDNENIMFAGHINGEDSKQKFLKNAKALLVPSVFEEPFGMVMIEALACGTPSIGLNSGAIPEVIQDGKNGYIVPKIIEKRQDKKLLAEAEIVASIANKLALIEKIDRRDCRLDFEKRFTLRRMSQQHLEAYRSVLQNN